MSVRKIFTRLEGLRRLRGLRVRDICDELHLHTAEMSRIESGVPLEFVPQRVRERLEDYFDESLEDLAEPLAIEPRPRGKKKTAAA